MDFTPTTKNITINLNLKELEMLKKLRENNIRTKDIFLRGMEILATEYDIS